MAEKKIVIEINENGEINAETFGMQGTACVSELDKLLRGLAHEATTYKKPEYFKEGISVINQAKITKK